MFSILKRATTKKVFKKLIWRSEPAAASLLGHHAATEPFAIAVK